MAQSASSGERAVKVLLVGDLRKAFLDTEPANACDCDVRPGLLEAVEAAARTRYDAIGIVMDGSAGRLANALRAIRKCTPASILLLARMYEEPLALSLVSDRPDQPRLADRYLVCPTTWPSLYRTVHELIPDSPPRRVAKADAKPAVSEAVAPAPSAPAEEPGRAESIPLDVETRIRHLEWLATTDDLTGLKNRRYIWEFTRQILDRARETEGQVTLLVFDIDNFKHYNDIYGHPVGDEILRQAALLMRRSCRPHDVVGRIGGDEFAVVFWDDPHQGQTRGAKERRSRDSDHPTEAIFIAKRFQKAFGRSELHLLGPNAEGVLTISGGLASFPRDGQTVDDLFARADAALLDAKRSGKNRIYLVGRPQNDIADIE
jgi:GGDEF domain-containing protein